MGHSVASVFGNMANHSLAPKQGHRPAPGPMAHAPGAPVGLRPSGVPLAPYGHAPAIMPGGPSPKMGAPAPGMPGMPGGPGYG